MRFINVAYCAGIGALIGLLIGLIWGAIGAELEAIRAPSADLPPGIQAALFGAIWAGMSLAPITAPGGATIFGVMGWARKAKIHLTDFTGAGWVPVLASAAAVLAYPFLTRALISLIVQALSSVGPSIISFLWPLVGLGTFQAVRSALSKSGADVLRIPIKGRSMEPRDEQSE
jgi:hypothetical protein